MAHAAGTCQMHFGSLFALFALFALPTLSTVGLVTFCAVRLSLARGLRRCAPLSTVRYLWCLWHYCC